MTKRQNKAHPRMEPSEYDTVDTDLAMFEARRHERATLRELGYELLPNADVRPIKEGRKRGP
jgi:hypothetical protein